MAMSEEIGTTHRRFHAGRHNALEVTFRDEDGNLVDDAGAEYRASFRTGWSAASVSFSRFATQTTPGVARIVIPPADTEGITPLPKVYVYEVMVTESDDRETTVEKGTVAILPPVAA
jgi:hypothetical protein